MKILIADDEPLARERLRRLLEASGLATEIHEAENGEEAVRLNATTEPDAILLDIRMPGMDGIEAARHIMQSSRPPALIFCTAYDEYAIAAFERGAVGYLLKPVQRDKLASALRSARAPTRLQLAELGRNERQHFSQHSASGSRLVPVAEVRLLMADQKYVTAYYCGGSVLLDESLRELEQEFHTRFLRIHRNALVARQHITGIVNRDRQSFIRLAGIDLEPPVSRRLLGEVRATIARL